QKKPRVYHAARRRGSSVAGRGARAAGRAGATHWRARARRRGRSGMADAPRSVPAGGGGIGLDDRSQRAHRHPLGHAQCCRDSQTGGRTGRARTRRHPRWRLLNDDAITAGDPNRTDRVHARQRSGGFRLGGQLGAAGWERHRVHVIRVQHRRKMMGLLKEIAPAVTRVAVLRDASQAFATSMFATMQAVAPPLGVEVIPVNMRNAAESEQSLESFARVANGGLIPASSAAAVRHRDLIIGLAARHKLPAVYWDRFFVVAGGLMSYGPDLVEQFRQAALYVDRILKGEKAADLQVQASTCPRSILSATLF